MFAHIEGRVSEKDTDSLVLDVGGVGFLLKVSRATLFQAPAAGEKMKLFTVMDVREDAIELYGFYSREEKRMYERLRAVTGVGSKTALQILSTLSVKDLSLALVTGDAKALERAPGVGKKMAQRLVLELRDKVDNESLVGANVSVAPMPGTEDIRSQAVEALVGLGYTAQEASRSVSAVASQTDQLDELIRLALKRG